MRLTHRPSSFSRRPLLAGTGPVDGSEWVDQVRTVSTVGSDYYSQESLHPNAYGERAIGKCIALSYAQASGNYTCRNTPGQDYNAMFLQSIP